MGKLKTVLLVDDDDTTNFLNKFFLKQLDANLEVNVAQNGKEAIDFLILNAVDITPCLLILDTNMPIMNGWEFLEAFENKIDEKTKKKIVIVMLTAVDTDSVVAKAMENPNVSDTSQKPLSDLIFRTLIAKHFS
ncbi:response regulator [Croceitalea rosinachiae]|uniref:Response regulator n=1 Tax=Croceitalea rosinachiae TaxID=3075596 RepID=A0ABU3ABU3_9FLAO|nr:response regulator [Croceitalea sp. F388]MDT0607645.1 response regulator [Croceitalea sp. F388]